MLGYLYILQSKKTHNFYIGSTIDVSSRLTKHNNGLVKSTKNRRPWLLVFSKEYPTIKIAKQIEYKLKSFKSRIIIEKIINEQNIRIEP
jgi:putative endonuclease